MPIYEFRCETCGYEFERMVPRTDSPNPLCPKALGIGPEEQESCGGQTHRLISVSNFQLVGGGWATDGYSR